MTFNTQHCLSYVERRIDFDLMARTINDLDADVVGLNEMRNEGPDPEYTDQVTALRDRTELKNSFFAQAIQLKEGPYGNGLLSKEKIVKAEVIPVPPPYPNPENRYYENRCLLKAELENGLTVLVIHFGLTPIEAENAVKTIVPHINGEKTVLMGDFNVLPEDPVLSPIRAKMTDASDVIIGSKLSFPSDKPDRKIDYVFVSRDIKVVSAEVPSVVASDHRPHTADIEI